MQESIRAKKGFYTACLKSIGRLVLIASIVLILFSPVQAAVLFFEDFINGVSDWQEIIVPGDGGSGSTGVEFHNGSEKAFAYHRGKGSHGLSKDFDYIADSRLEFDMHAVAVIGSNYSGTRTLHSTAGVTISFLNFLNSPLGSLSIVNTTGSVGAQSVSVDNSPHIYSALMRDFAVSAGLSDSDPITKINLTFYSTADYSWGGNIYPNGYSSATVWFDNVGIDIVPIPGAILLLGSGILGFAGISRRRHF